MKHWREAFLMQSPIVRFFREQRAGSTGSGADYTLCVFRAEAPYDRLSVEGTLAERLGLAMPETLTGLACSAESWGILPEQREKTLSALRSLSDGSAELRYELDVFLMRGGRECWLSVNAVRRGGELELLIADMEARKRQMEQLVRETMTDPLTGALNRAAAETVVDLFAADEKPHLFIMVDLDGFKAVNDTCGHNEGDRVLSETFRSLKEELWEDHVLCRVGGDEFFIAIADEGDQPENLARRICARLRRTLPGKLSISASLGVAVSPRDGRDFRTLYPKADLAMYTAKRQGGDRWVQYDPSLRMDSDERPNARLFPVENATSILYYDVAAGAFRYSEASAPFAGEGETRPFWRLLLQDRIVDEKDGEDICLRVLRMADSGECAVENQEYLFRMGGERRHYLITFLCDVPGTVQLVLTDMSSKVQQVERLRSMAEYDRLTGLLNVATFSARLDSFFGSAPKAAASGEYAVVYLDVVRFKAVNDLYGEEEGNRLLLYIADRLSHAAGPGGYACRIGSDRFALLLHASGRELDRQLNALLDEITAFRLPMQITCSAGVYSVRDPELAAPAMLDRARMAQDSVKGRYDQRFGRYTEAMRWQLLHEQELVGGMDRALKEQEFTVYFQPQYNHVTGLPVGAEALVRWMHPTGGLISPGEFIPIFEKNGFITRLDLFVFEQVCAFQRRSMDAGLPRLPVSVNITRVDIFQPDFIDRLEALRKKYGVPAALIRVEITESAVMGSSEFVSSIVRRLHDCGYVVEMDDFGSGYSSLNVLKDIDFDVIKLDMRFLSETTGTGRGGTILSSVVRMAKWLDLPVIAEGVETAEQADFLRSIGCDYVQGYLYAHPMPADEYSYLLGHSSTAVLQQGSVSRELHADRFWDPASLETLLFSNLVGGAAVIDYHAGQVSVLRVNRKYLNELGTGLSEDDLLRGDPMRVFDETGRADYCRTLDLAAETGTEQECETWRHYVSDCCGEEDICLRSTVQLIGRSEIGMLFYVMIRNVTAEKRRFGEILDSERRFKAASEQANIYYWEYDVATKEMRPCFRCMRDLGLPPLVKNYPEPAIAMGIFPPEVADQYRDWHRQIEAGVPALEAVMPLTVGRVPFHVRYTTVFDEQGRPVKAYGSATLAVESA